jgi:gliding motility-associated-like protein
MKFLIALLSLLSTTIIAAQEIEHTHNIHYSLIENKGQWDEPVLFQSKSQQHTIWVQQHGFIYDIRDYSQLKKAHLSPNPQLDSLTVYSTIVAAEFLGSNRVNEIVKEGASAAYFNYFLGNKKEKWVNDVHGFASAHLKNFYSNIDLKIFDNNEQFKYELWCAPNADISQIAMKIKGAKGVYVDDYGNLVIQTVFGPIMEKKPVAYELLNGRMKEVSCDFEVTDNVVKFKLGNYSRFATLIIDPTLIFATYCGSVTDNFGMTATYGYDGTAYSAGTIYGNAYPTPDNLAYDVTSNFTVANIGSPVTTDAFISRYSPDGTTMLWTTFLGGGDNTQGTETSHSLICDKQNNLYILGVTSSTDFPVVNGFQTAHGGGTPLQVQFNGSNFGNQGTDIYVAKFSSDGHQLLGSTYVGGSLNDGVNFKVSSGSYNTVAAYDSLTTNYGDQFRGEIMIDSLGNCIVASCSRSANFPVLNAFQPTLAGNQDGVVFKLSSDLSTMLWSSYYGGSNNDACYSVKIDSSYNIVFAGGTSSNNLPGTTGGVNPSYMGGKADGFVAKLTPDGQTLTQSTYLGTANYDQTFFVEINRNDEVFVLGQSTGGVYPTINAVSNPNSGQYISKLTPTLSSFTNSMVFGNGNGNFNISPAAFLVDICGNMYVSGWGANLLQSTPLSGMPVSSNAFQSTPPNGFDFYLTVIDKDFDGLLYGSYLGGNAAEEHVDGGTSRFDKNGVVYQSVCGGCGGNSDFPTTANAWSNNNLSTNCNNLVFKFDFELLPEAEFSTDDLLGCAAYTVQLQNTSPPSDAYYWVFGNGDTSTVYSPTVTYTDPGTYVINLYVTDSICLLTDTATITINVLEPIVLSVSNDTLTCTPSPMVFTADSDGTATSFIWSSNDQFTDTLNVSVSDSTLTVTPDQTTTYYVQVSNGACSEIDSVTVTIVSGDLSIVGPDTLCLGNSGTLTAAIQVAGLTFDYDWSPMSVLTTTSQDNVVTAHPTTTTWIYCTATASNGCEATDSILISVGSLGGTVAATATPEVVVPGETTQLNATPSGLTYQWSPATGLNNSTLQNPVATVDETTTYTVTASNAFCSQSASVQVKVLSVLCDRTFVYVPNAFSPNGDGENEVLYVRSAIASKILFRVFDRWGEMVFETTDMNSGWDGTFRGKLIDPDTYDYYLEADCYGGEKAIIKGNITLIR